MLMTVPQLLQRKRLEEQEPPIHPFLRAPESPLCELYWVGVSAFPMGIVQREWLHEFFVRLSAALKQQHGLRGEFFLQYKAVPLVEKRFRTLAADIMPRLGLARRPNGPLPRPPTRDQLAAAARGKGDFDITKHFPDYCFWLRNPELSMLLTEFFGLGGSAMFYLEPDPATTPPEIPFKAEMQKLFPQMRFDKMEAMMQGALATKDGFLTASKQLFGEGLEQEVEYRGLPYIVPQLETHDFFTQPEKERQKWFRLFRLFWRESPADNGVYLASAIPLESMLIQILEAMKEAGKHYPEH
jgi:hypothetical protein